jgi:hypothetical protein
MFTYAFMGEFDEFPAFRAEAEAAGVQFVSIATLDEVIHIQTEGEYQAAQLVLVGD